MLPFALNTPHLRTRTAPVCHPPAKSTSGNVLVCPVFPKSSEPLGCFLSILIWRYVKPSPRSIHSTQLLLSVPSPLSFSFGSLLRIQQGPFHPYPLHRNARDLSRPFKSRKSPQFEPPVPVRSSLSPPQSLTKSARATGFGSFNAFCALL